MADPRLTALLGSVCAARLERVYAQVWGRDRYRRKGLPFRGRRVAVHDIAEVLESLPAPVATRLGIALSHTWGLTDDRAFMWPLSAAEAHAVGGLWQDAMTQVKARLPQCPESLMHVAAEWLCYTANLRLAEACTGRSDVDSFEGVVTSGMGDADQAHRLYERADLVAVSALVEQSCRPPEHWAAVLASDWQEALAGLLRGHLYGDGKTVGVIESLIADSPLAERLHHSLAVWLGALRPSWRQAGPPETWDAHTLATAWTTLKGCVQPISEDPDEAWRRHRQGAMRWAEGHLHRVEQQFAAFAPSPSREADAATLYKQAVDRVLDGAASGSGDCTLLTRFRSDLVGARHAADRQQPHSWLYWNGDGESSGQLRQRWHCPRYRLYHFEAWCERLYVALESALSEAPNDLEAAMQTAFNQSERGLWVQRWIARLGPRRPAMFGYEAVCAVPDNRAILDQDRWVWDLTRRLRERGQPEHRWGAIQTGLTERLRTVIRHIDGAQAHVDALLDRGETHAVLQWIRHQRPYDPDQSLTTTTPWISCGVHVHHANPDVLAETLMNLREVDWPQADGIRLLGTTSSRRDVAQAEHALCLKHGVVRFGLANRQLLKSGNQNRILPNVSPEGRESFYLTLDDDYLAATNTLARMAPILLRQPTAAYVQTPLFFRAAMEPGHSLGRRADAVMLVQWCHTMVIGLHSQEPMRDARRRPPSSPRPGVSFPLGTNTLYRMTWGHSLLRGVGGFVANPDELLSGEDWASGAVSLLMMVVPDSFEEGGATWTSGLVIDEVWVTGDSIDFAPGGVKQKYRWADGGARTSFRIVLPHLWKTGNMGVFRTQRMAAALVHLVGMVVPSVLGSMALLLMPLLLLVPTGGDPVLSWGLVLASALWFVGASAAMDIWIKRPTGGTLRDYWALSTMNHYGTALSCADASWRAIFLKPDPDWKAFKGRRKAHRLLVGFMALAVYQLVGGVLGMVFGHPVLAWCFVSTAYLLGLIPFFEVEASDLRDKSYKIARDCRGSLWQTVSSKMSLLSHTPGRRMRPMPVVRVTTAYIVGSLLVAGSIQVVALSAVLDGGWLRFGVHATLLLFFDALVLWNVLVVWLIGVSDAGRHLSRIDTERPVLALTGPTAEPKELAW